MHACTHKFTGQSPLQGDESSSLLPEKSPIRYNSSHAQFTFHSWTISSIGMYIYNSLPPYRSEQVAVGSEISDQFYSASGGNVTYVQSSI